MNRLRGDGVRHEAWLPFVAGTLWWVALYPGLFGEDSLITLAEARSGHVTVWFTAWWIYLVRFVSLDTHAIPLVTLAGIWLLVWSTREWAASALPPGPSRRLAITTIAASPLIGALGIQLRHDAWMTSGLLLWAATVTRTRGFRESLTMVDYLQLAAVVVLVPTRHNGLPTLVVGSLALLCLYLGSRRRFAAILLIVGLGGLGLTTVATRAAGATHSVDPAQMVEAVSADISCLISRGVEPSEADWTTLESIAARPDWAQPRACQFVNPIFAAPSFRLEAFEGRTSALLRVWLDLTWKAPLEVVAIRAQRATLFLPPLATGLPDATATPFIHSTILPNDFGLTFAFPRVAEAARVPARLWNAGRMVLANAALWLIALWGLAAMVPALRPGLVPAAVLSSTLLLGLLVTAPISEGRYGLLILICGQLAALHELVQRFGAGASGSE